MPTEKIEIEILAKGKPAEKAIKGVEKKTDQLGKTTKKVGKETDGVLAKMRAGWLAVGASVAIAVNKAATFERASIGLTKAQKEWAQETAKATDITAEQVAGFLKSAQTARLAEEKMKELAKQAIALGYAFPHEDAETLHDNLVMLNSTGEAQGFIVDILEQHYAKLGVSFKDLDLKAVSMADKLSIINEVVAESQRQMDASKFQDYNRVMGEVDQSLTDLGTTLVTLGSEKGGFSLVKTILDGLRLSIQFVYAGLQDITAGIGELFDKLGIAHEKQVETIDLDKKELNVEEKLANAYSFRAALVKDLTIATGAWREAVLRQIDTVDKQIKGLEEHGDAHHYVKEKIQESKDAYEELNKTTDKTKNKLAVLNQTGKDVAKSFGDVFANMVMGVKTSFADMARSIIARLVQVRMEALATQYISSMSGGSGIFGTIARLFTSHTGTAQVKHTGGAIGLAGIPSFHTGVRSDERLAKLQVGEAVINRGGAAKNRDAIEAMNKGYSVGNAGNVTQAEINFNVTAIDAASFNQYLVGNKHTIEGIINRSLQTNGTVRQTIKQVV